MILLKSVILTTVCLQVLQAKGFEPYSIEVNRVDNDDMSLFYDAVVFNDITDIMDDFEHNRDSTFDAFRTSESGSNENIEDLLSEYQAYLDRAKERKNLHETRKRNKGPSPSQKSIYRKENSINGKHSQHRKNLDYFYLGEYPRSKSQYFPQNNDLDYFVPIKEDQSNYKKIDPTFSKIQMTVVKRDPNKPKYQEPKIIELPPVISKLRIPTFPYVCICNETDFPCNCECEECSIAHKSIDSKTGQLNTRFFKPSKQALAFQPPSLYFNRLDNDLAAPTDTDGEINEKTINIRLKVEIQLPNSENQNEHKCNHSQVKISDSKEEENTPLVTIPFPYFNSPIQLDTLDFTKTHKPHRHNVENIHKVTIHKKKKSKHNNNIKKHKKKLSNHSHHLEGKTMVVMPDSYYNDSNDNTTEFIPTVPTTTTEVLVENNVTQEKEKFTNVETITTDKAYTVATFNTTNTITSTKPEEKQSGFKLVSERPKTENTIEIDLETDKNEIVTTEGHTQEVILKRQKRFLISPNETKNIELVLPITVESQKINNMPMKTTKIQDDVTLNTKKELTTQITKVVEKHKLEKNLLDDDLLYWPSSNTNNNLQKPENITKIILDKETNKAKFNLSKETIRQDHTKALEQAIFGKVDWNDIDTVAPVFMSFVGKYLNGVLTFCSDKICHSMKCGHKRCVHRVCTPDNRQNHIGHCLGSNSTDSVASMESLMDLPSNTVSEVVDILQDKMLGKIFGKATLCTNTKCVTMTAYKKNFLEKKCSIKDLNPWGHCSSKI